MIPLALPAIFAAVEGVIGLFNAGKQVYEQVAGKPSTADTPAALTAEVMALPADKIDAWAKGMEAEVARYKAETDRIKVEEGEVTPELLHELTPAAASRVAVLRMTSRPVIALRMSHVILLPAYLLAIDALITTINVVSFAFGRTFKLALVSTTLLDDTGSIYRWLYEQATGPAAAIVMTYMCVRAVEKVASKDGVASSITNAISGVKGLFGKTR